MRVLHVVELGDLGEEPQLDLAGRAVALLGDDDFGLVLGGFAVCLPVSIALLVFLLGIVASLIGAVAMTLILEHLNKSLRTPEEVERRLDLPVLISLPRVASGHLAMY